MSDKPDEHYATTRLSARLSSHIIEMIDRFNPDVFCEEGNEGFCIRLQEMIARETTAFLDEIGIR